MDDRVLALYRSLDCSDQDRVDRIIEALVDSRRLAEVRATLGESANEDTKTKSPSDDVCDCDYHAGRPAPALAATGDAAPCESITLGPREPFHSKSEQKRVEALRAARAGEYRIENEGREPGSKFGRNQRRQGVEYRRLPSGRRVPVCCVDGCQSLAAYDGKCKRHWSEALRG